MSFYKQSLYEKHDDLIDIVDWFEWKKKYPDKPYEKYSGFSMSDFEFSPKPTKLKVSWSQLSDVTLDNSFSLSAEDTLVEMAAKEVNNYIVNFNFQNFLVMEKWGKVKWLFINKETHTDQLICNDIWSQQFT